MVQDTRVEHLLKQGKKQGFPQHCIFFDTETKHKKLENGCQEHRFYLGWSCYVSFRKREADKHREQWHYIKSKKDFANLILSKAKANRVLYVFASNVWFDIRITKIDKYLFEKGYICDRLYNKNLVTILGFRKGTTAIIFLSIQNIVPFSVDDIGLWLGKPKIKIDFETCTKTELSKYCRHDTDIIKDFVLRWLAFSKRAKMGSFQCTSPAQAFAAFRSRFMQHKIYIHHNKDVIALERKAYFGGRTECFTIGKIKAKTIYKLDINGMYTHVMRDNFYPIRFQSIFENCSIDYLQDVLKNYCVVADIQVKLKEPYIAHKLNEKTCFPIGKYNAVVNTPAAKYLLKQNAIKYINKLVIYQRAKIFKAYMDFFGQEKEKFSAQGDSCGNKIAKYFTICLYGKFGQKKEMLVDEENVSNEIIEYILTYNMESGYNGKLITYGGFRRLYEDRGESSKEAFVAVAGHVTEHARLLLWRYIGIAGRENSFYCDTDSLFVNNRGKENLQKAGFIHPDKLGYFKIEDETKHCVIRACKDYEFGDVKKRKGIRKDAEQIDDRKFKQFQFQGLYSYLQKHPDNYIIQNIIKQLSGEYDKGIVTKSGKVLPYTLGDSLIGR